MYVSIEVFFRLCLVHHFASFFVALGDLLVVNVAGIRLIVIRVEFIIC